MHETIFIIDFGSQYTQLIARRLRELNIYCEIHPFNKLPTLHNKVKGIILSGGPSSVRDSEAPVIDLMQYRGQIPLLGVCYGAQLLAHQFGGEVAPSKIREYGRAILESVNTDCKLFSNVSANSQVWMSHADTIARLPEGFTIKASTKDVQAAAFEIAGEETFGIQFHPEVTHSSDGKTILKNFAVNICGCLQDWTPAAFAQETIGELQNKIQGDKVILAFLAG